MRRRGDEITLTVKHGQCSIHSEEQIESNLLSQHRAVSHNPYGTRLVAQGFVLVQDNDPKHTSRLYQKLKAE